MTVDTDWVENRARTRRIPALRLREFWTSRELAFQFTVRDIKVRYKQTVLGAAWAVLQPLLTMVVFTIIFGRLAKVPTDGVPYPVFAYAALLPWQMFARSLNESGNSLVTNRQLITKIYFPRLLLPISSVLASLVDFAIAFVVFATGFWIFAFSPWARDMFQAVDQLQDENLVLEIEARCVAALDELDALPSIRSAESPGERAGNLDLANAALLGMTDDIANLGTAFEDDGRLIGLWLSDWEIYMADRVAHAERLREGQDVRFLNTEADGIFIAERMNGFARVNNMDSCQVPGDL